MERGLVLRQYFFGAESDEVWKACKTLGEMCNLLAMTYLQQEDFNMVLELLKKAEILTERDAGGRAATFNNLACYYRRQGKLHAALLYLQKVSESLPLRSPLVRVLFPFICLLIPMNRMLSLFLSFQALKIEARLVNVQNPADTHINACAVLSQLGRHQTALEHAQQALILLQEELLAPRGSTGIVPSPQVRTLPTIRSYVQFLKGYLM